jgi:two-component system sensor histidine kinase/response regulator
MLKRAGYTRVTTLQDSREVSDRVRVLDPDIILLDLLMPFKDGYEVMAELGEIVPAGTYLPILVLTADVTPQALERALSSGARDFLTKPFQRTELLLRVRNLLETRHLYLSLQRQLEHLEKIGEETRQTISTMTHDINQPLAAVRLLTESMQQEMPADSLLGKALASDLVSIHAASEQMGDMIQEVSDMARLQIGRPLVLTRTSQDLVDLVEEQIKATSRASRRKVTFETDAKSLVGAWDRQRLTRVVSNLLSNALKFSPKSESVAVVLTTAADSARLTVSDHGVGIPADDLPHIFEPYYRAGNVLGTVEGSGLGLSSTRQIVEQHGGSISVESVEGEGAIFIVTLPLT